MTINDIEQSLYKCDLNSAYPLWKLTHDRFIGGIATANVGDMQDIRIAIYIKNTPTTTSTSTVFDDAVVEIDGVEIPLTGAQQKLLAKAFRNFESRCKQRKVDLMMDKIADIDIDKEMNRLPYYLISK